MTNEQTNNAVSRIAFATEKKEFASTSFSVAKATLETEAFKTLTLFETHIGKMTSCNLYKLNFKLIEGNTISSRL